MSQISVRNVSMGYEKKLILREVSFDVEQGDYLCIVGENGSGKTTLMKGILGLMPLKSGTIQFGEGVKSNQIGYLPQQTAVQKDFPASAYEVVLSGRLPARGILPFYSRKDKAVVDENIERLGIEPLRNRCYRELSGGQQQRVLLARALCATKKVLLLDEPVAGLDPVVTQELYRLIEKINCDMGITVIMVSHDVQCAVRYASHILHLKNRQAFFGTTADYLNSPVGKAFVGGERYD